MSAGLILKFRHATDPDSSAGGGSPRPAPASPAARPQPSLLVPGLLTALIAALWFCAFIGLRPLANPDEGRYTEIAREMAASGDFVTPRLNGVKYFEKPPLLYWLSSLTFRAFGINHFTARIWTALFATLGCVLVYHAASRLYGRRAGAWAAVVLATTLIYYALAQVVLLDMAVSVMISGALLSFLLAVREPAGRSRFWLFMAHYAFMALATLSKGLIGFLIPGAVMFLWLLLLGRWRMLRPFHLLPGALLFLAIAAPWHVAAAIANHSPQRELDFAWFYFIHEHFERFTTTVHRRFEPWWFFIPILVGGLFPWTLLCWQALSRSLVGGWRQRTQNADAWFFLIWIVFILVFFSASRSKLIPYILPVIPAFAILIGRYLAERWSAKATRGLLRGGWAFAVTAAGMGIAALLVPAPRDQESLAQAWPFFQSIFALVLIPAAFLTALATLRRSPRWIIGSMTAAAALLFAGMASMGRSIDGGSTRKLADILQQDLEPGDRIIHVGLYAQDMPVYLGRQVDVAAYQGELLFGIQSEPHATAPRFISRDRFVAEWQQPRTTYALMRTYYYDKWFSRLDLDSRIIGRSGDLYLLVNHSNPSS